MSRNEPPNPLVVLAGWAAAPRAFSALARGRAVDAIADTLACMAAGRDDAVVGALREALSGGIGEMGAAGVVGGGRAAPGLAAFVNGTAAHALDYDDNFRPARSHASAVLVPALLAAAEHRKARGRTFVDAYIIGLEAQAYIGRGLDDAHYRAGWHPTGTVAAIGSAIGAGWLMGLDEAGVAAAASNAVSMAAGLKVQFGTAMKPVHSGFGARAAVEAALLASAGIAGNPAVLDHPSGFRALYGGAGAPGWEGLVPGAPLAIETEGLVPKLFPCCGATHWALDMLFALRRKHGFGAHEVTGIEVELGEAYFGNLPYAVPRNEMEARFSMPYCLALALLQDRLTLADFTPDAVTRSEVRALLPLTAMRVNDIGSDGRTVPGMPHRLHLTLRDGTRLHAERHEVRGSIHEPFSEEEKRGKFLSCLAIGGIPSDAAGPFYDRLLRLGEGGDLDAAETLLALG
jgi:2-methylcitrate dehydratase PrpD